MKPCIIRKIVYRSVIEKRPTWGFVLSEREGLALLLVPSTHEKWSHSIVVATENVAERVFEDVASSRFTIEADDMLSIGTKMIALGDEITDYELEQWLKSQGW